MVKQSYYENFLIHIISYYVSAIFILIFAFIKILGFILSNLFYIIFPYKSKPYNDHEKNLAKVQKQVRDWNNNGRKTKMCTGRPGWRTLSIRTPIYKDTLTKINIDMNKIIYINTKENTKNVVCVEPLITMGELTYELCRQGWTLPVVPELNELTIGGLVCGAGLETSSHKYGLFHNICVSYEFVLASGEVVKCTQDQNSDLYYTIPGSHGTLGFLTAVELEIIRAKTHIKLEYIPVHSLNEIITTFNTQTYRKQGNEFVEGIMYSLNEGVIMVGQMTSSPSSPNSVNHIGKWYKPWFYKHVETFLKKTNDNNNEKLIEYIPLRDYYHRHTRGLFWVNENIIPYGNNIIFRYLFGWLLPPRIDYIKLLIPKNIIYLFDKNHITQDFVVPMNKLKDALILTHNTMEIYPIWLCPAKLINTPGAGHFLNDKDEMYVDFGVYGISKLKEYETIKSARILEIFCLENRGYQAVYSDIYLTRDEMGKMFKPDLYLKMRQQLNCEDAFPDVYDKVCRAARR